MKKLVFLVCLVVLAFGFVFELETKAADDIQSGEELTKKLDYRGAAVVYEKILTADPKNYDALWRAADDYISLGEMATTNEKSALYEKASEYATKAVEINPDKIEGHVKLANAQGRLALFKGGKIKVRMSKTIKAEAEKALQIDPENDEALHILGAWHREVATLPGILKTIQPITSTG